MNKFLKKVLDFNYFEVLNAFFGWVMFSVLTLVGLSLISEILGINSFNELSIDVRIIIALLLGYCFWFPHWDKRCRG